MIQEFEKVFQFKVEQCDAGSRLDKWLVKLVGSDYSRAQIQQWIIHNHVTCPDYNKINRSLKIKFEDSFKIEIPFPELSTIEPVDLNLPILYEDKYLAVIHKPAGLATHPGPGDKQLSVVHGIMHIWQQLADEVTPTSHEIIRPGIVHRLDKATEGLLIIGLQDKTRRKLMGMFEKREIHKKYRAWLGNKLPNTKERIELAIARHPVNRLKMQINPRGRLSITAYERIKNIQSNKGRSFDYVNLTIETGRTHQIRVHMAHLGASVIGDPLYSRTAKKYEKFGMLLFASDLKFKHPETGVELQFSLEDPERFTKFGKNCQFY